MDWDGPRLPQSLEGRPFARLRKRRIRELSGCTRNCMAIWAASFYARGYAPASCYPAADISTRCVRESSGVRLQQVRVEGRSGSRKTASATNSQRRECVNHQQPWPSRKTASAINSQRARRKQSYTELWRGTRSNLRLRLRSKRDTTCSYTCGPSFFNF